MVSDGSLRQAYFGLTLAGGCMMLWLSVTLSVGSPHFRRPRAAALNSLCLSRAITAINSSLLFFSNHLTGPPPPSSLCLAQGSLVLAQTPLVTTTSMAFVIYVWLSISSPSQGIFDGWQRASILLSFPYIIFISLIIAAVLIGVQNADLSNRHLFTCQFDHSMLMKTSTIITGIALLATMIIIVLIIFLIYTFKSQLHDADPIPVEHMVARLVCLAIYSFARAGLALATYVMFEESYIIDLIVATDGIVICLIFGSQRWILLTWLGWFYKLFPCFGGGGENSSLRSPPAFSVMESSWGATTPKKPRIMSEEVFRGTHRSPHRLNKSKFYEGVITSPPTTGSTVVNPVAPWLDPSLYRSREEALQTERYAALRVALGIGSPRNSLEFFDNRVSNTSALEPAPARLDSPVVHNIEAESDSELRSPSIKSSRYGLAIGYPSREPTPAPRAASVFSLDILPTDKKDGGPLTAFSHASSPSVHTVMDFIEGDNPAGKPGNQSPRTPGGPPVQRNVTVIVREVPSTTFTVHSPPQSPHLSAMASSEGHSPDPEQVTFPKEPKRLSRQPSFIPVSMNSSNSPTNSSKHSGTRHSFLPLNTNGVRPDSVFKTDESLLSGSTGKVKGSSSGTMSSAPMLRDVPVSPSITWPDTAPLSSGLSHTDSVARGVTPSAETVFYSASSNGGDLESEGAHEIDLSDARPSPRIVLGSYSPSIPSPLMSENMGLRTPIAAVTPTRPISNASTVTIHHPFASADPASVLSMSNLGNFSERSPRAQHYAQNIHLHPRNSPSPEHPFVSTSFESGRVTLEEPHPYSPAASAQRQFSVRRKPIPSDLFLTQVEEED